MNDSSTAIPDGFADVDSCAASDALDQLGIQGVALGAVRLTTTAAVRGRAITVRMGPLGTRTDEHEAPSSDEGSTSAGATPRRHLGTAAVEAAEPGDVIVIDNGGRTDSACWGGNLARAARAAGVAAIVADGAIRDRDECEEVGLPVFARRAVPTTARGRIVELAWNVPVTVEGVTVRPGDVVVADGSGVVFVPGDRAAEVAEAAGLIVEKERLMAAEIDRGVPVSQVMGASYEDMLRKKP